MRISEGDTKYNSISSGKGPLWGKKKESRQNFLYAELKNGITFRSMQDREKSRDGSRRSRGWSELCASEPALTGRGAVVACRQECVMRRSVLKRVLYTMLMLLAVLAAAGCTEERAPEQQTGTVVPGISATEIRIGSSLALSGHAGYLGAQTLMGALSYLNHVNESGGVHGRKITLVAYDDKYDPPLCVANTQKLIIEDDVFLLFCYVGTPTTLKIIPMVQEARIPLLGMFTGANALREPFQRYIINVRASYYQETAEAVRRFVEDLGLDRIAVFYQYDAYGFDGLKGAELALREYGLAPVARGSYARGTHDVEEGLERIAASGAQAVVMIGTYEPCARFISLARERGFNPLFHNVSFVGAEELARRLRPEEGERVFVTQVVPPSDSPGSRTMLQGAGEYIDMLQRYFPGEKPSSVGLEGYINARVLVEALQRAGKDLTREGFLDAVESIQNFSVGIDNTITFSENDHQGLDQVYFTRYRDGRFELITDWSAIRREPAPVDPADALR